MMEIDLRSKISEMRRQRKVGHAPVEDCHFFAISDLLAGCEHTDSIRLQMRTMAKAFRGRDGALVKALLAEAQFDAELATAFRERWTLPRRKMALAVFHEAVRQGVLRPDVDLEATIDLLYAPMYYRLQMGTGPLSDAYIDGIFDQAMEGLFPRKEVMPSDR